MPPRRRRIHSPSSPRAWPAWIGIGLLYLVSHLPYGTLIGLGRALGRLAYRVAGRRRYISRVNLGLCFPELSSHAREELVKRHFESLAIGVLTSGLAWWAPDKKLKPLVDIEGLEHLDAALAQGHGALLLSAHFTDLEITGRLMTMHHTIAGMYRRHEHPVIEHYLQRNRDRHTVAAIPRDDVKQVIRVLRQNHPVWYAPDQGFTKQKHSIMAPFFGVPAPTNPATPRLAKVSGAPVLPFFGFRRADGQGYRLIIQPPLADFPTGDAEADTARVNQIIEGMVRHAPEQYLWAHRRFKARKGEPDPYGKRPRG